MIEYAVLGGFVLDCLFGDPAWRSEERRVGKECW